MATAQEYIDKLYNQGQSQAGKLKEQRTQADEEFIKQVQDAIDQSTASATKPYQTQIEQLQSQYRELYDANAVQELVNRRQVQETMANMGLTDSGLNRTQQTAIALQRGNADAAARLEQQQKTQELQDKIAQIIESGAAQKQQQEAAIRNDSANWYNSLLGDIYNNAVSQGTSQYNAEQERAALEYQAKMEAEAAKKQAELEAQAAIEKAKLEAQQQAFENNMQVVDALNKAGASQKDIYSYLNNAGIVQGGLTSNMTHQYAPQPRGYYLLNEMDSGRMTKQQAAQDIVQNFNGDIDAMKIAAQTAGVTDLLYSALASTIDSSALDSKTRYSAQYRGQYLGPRITSGKISKLEAVADIMESFKGNDAAMIVAAEYAGVLPELMERYQ